MRKSKKLKIKKEMKSFSEQEVRKLLSSVAGRQPSFIVFRHFRRASGAVTACCSVIRVGDTFNLTVGFSLCSPDDQFSRQKGREESLKRLLESPVLLRNATKVSEPLMKYMKNYVKNGMLTSITNAYRHKQIPGKLHKWFASFVEEL